MLRIHYLDLRIFHVSDEVVEKKAPHRTPLGVLSVKGADTRSTLLLFLGWLL
jgi:hypothetical protein